MRAAGLEPAIPARARSQSVCVFQFRHARTIETGGMKMPPVLRLGDAAGWASDWGRAMHNTKYRALPRKFCKWQKKGGLELAGVVGIRLSPMVENVSHGRKTGSFPPMVGI